MDVEVFAQAFDIDADAAWTLAKTVGMKAVGAMTVVEIVKALLRRIKRKMPPNAARALCFALTGLAALPELLGATPVVAACALALAYYAGTKTHDWLTGTRDPPKADLPPKPPAPVTRGYAN